MSPALRRTAVRMLVDRHTGTPSRTSTMSGTTFGQLHDPGLGVRDAPRMDKRVVLDENPEAELALLLAGTRGRREGHAERIRTLAGAASPDRLVTELAGQRMLPLLGARLLEYAREGLSSTLITEIESAISSSLRFGAAQELAMRYVVGHLERQGLPCLPVKGQSLSRVIYGQPGFRSATDIDLLVSMDDLQNAAAVLEQEGFETIEAARNRGRTPLLHVVLRAPPGSGLPAVELHWRLHWYEQAFSAETLERSHVDASGSRRARPSDELAALHLFYARDGFVGLRFAADIAAWWDAFDEADPGALLRETMIHHPSLRPALRAATRVCSRLVGTDQCDSSGMPKSLRREGLAVRLANWSRRGDREQVSSNVALIDALLSPPGTARAFAERQLYAAASEATVAVHAAKTLARFAPALWSVRRGRSHVPLPSSTA